MKRPGITTACCLLLASIAVAESVQVRTVEPQESSHPVVVAVVLAGKPLRNMRGEFGTTPGDQVWFSALTGDDGLAEPQALTLKTYHIVATFEDGVGADLYRHISDKSRAKSFSIDLTKSLETSQEALASAEKLPIRERVQEFKDASQDHSGAVIPGVNIKVARKGSADKKDGRRLKSSANGSFSAPLADEVYGASFSFPGFRSEIVPFAVRHEERKKCWSSCKFPRNRITDGEYSALNA